MAVEIKELIIRAVVDYEAADSDLGKEDTKTAQAASVDEQRLIQACVKQVLKILRKKEKR